MSAFSRFTTAHPKLIIATFCISVVLAGYLVWVEVGFRSGMKRWQEIAICTCHFDPTPECLSVGLHGWLTGRPRLFIKCEVGKPSLKLLDPEPGEENLLDITIIEGRDLTIYPDGTISKEAEQTEHGI